MAVLRLPTIFLLLAVAASPAQTADLPETLDQSQIQSLIREAAEKDAENDKKQRDYTYIERTEEHRLDGKGSVKSTETRTREIMIVYEEPIERLIEKDDKPLSASDATKEEERIQKIIDKRKNESEKDRAKRLKQEEKDREEARDFVSEIADAYNFHLVGTENIEGRETYAIDAEPRPGFQPHVKGAQFLPKFRFRVWIDKTEKQWVRIDALAIDTVSLGGFLARFHKGCRIVIEETRVNDEVWLPEHMAVKIDVRLALLKNFNIDQDVTYKDYKKFRTDTKITPLGEVQ
jgi:hypothetical protein